MTISPFRLALILAGSAALAACGGSEEPAAEETTAAEDTEQRTASAEPEMLQAPEGSQAADAMVIGSPDAPLTVVEYASVTCPGCAAFHNNTFGAIKEQLIETGQVRFEFRELPTAPRREAFAGFILARCSATTTGPQSYFAVIDALFKRQNAWVRGPNRGQELRNIAVQAGLDDTGFEECFRRQDIRDAIQGNIDLARENNVSGTPTFFIDGERFELPFNPEEAVAALTAEVEKRR